MLTAMIKSWTVIACGFSLLVLSLYCSRKRINFILSNPLDVSSETRAVISRKFRSSGLLYSSELNVFDAMQRFVQPRDNPPPSTATHCANCPLNTTCFESKDNFWHPTKCRPIRRYSKKELESNVSLIVIGDSRMRVLFGALLRRFYDDEEATRVQTTSNESVPLSVFRKPNKEVKGGMHRDFWVEDSGGKTKILFLWDKKLKVSRTCLINAVTRVKPRVVVISAGPWFAWNGHLDLKKYSAALKAALDNFLSLSEKYSFRVILAKQTPLLFPQYGVQPRHIEQINSAAEELLNQYSDEPRLVYWDSHYKLAEEYLSYCALYTIGERVSDGQWRCDDPVHPGPVIADHFADMVLNYVIDYI